jgi:hypothetical protein
VKIAEAEWNRCISGTRRLIVEAQAVGDKPFERALRQMLGRLHAQRMAESVVDPDPEDDPRHIRNILAKVIKRLGHPDTIEPLRIYTYWRSGGGHWTSEEITLERALRIPTEGEA